MADRKEPEHQDRYTEGDHLSVQRPWYSHHGIYVGNDRVVEFGGDKHNKSAAAIREVSLTTFEDCGRARIVNHDKPSRLASWAPTALPRQERVERALFLVSTAAPGRYNLFGHNCEHVATWCATGFPESHQVRVGLYVNMLRSLGTVIAASAAYRVYRRMPMWIPLTTLIFFLITMQYHIHQGRFVREIDRAWRASRRDGPRRAF